MGDYNCEVVEQAMHVFSETFNKSDQSPYMFQKSRQS